MNLQSWMNKVAGAFQRPVMTTGLPDGTRRTAPHFSTRMTFKSARLWFALAVGGVIAPAMITSAQTNYYGASGTQYAVIGSLFGDQVFPDASISTSGGFVVWQDNATDGDGWGISARRLDSTLSGTLGIFRVNTIGAGNQENPRVARLKNGGAVFVWQGGQLGNQHIYARFMSATNTFTTTNDILVSAFTNNFQVNPAVTVLNNSNVVIVWGSYNQFSSNSLQDVYGQILTPAGDKVGGNFLVNQFTSFNQRTPAVAALAGGGFAVAWISEQQRQLAASPGTNTTLVPGSVMGLVPSVDVYARCFGGTGSATGSEFLVNTDINPCASPTLAAASDGTFLIAWSARDLVNSDNSLDIRGRIFTAAGTGGSVFYVNTHTYGDQYLPRVSSIGLDYLVTWTSLGQDGSREGVYGQFIHNNGGLVGSEFLVNATTIGQQMQPCVTSDGISQFLVAWTSFSGYPNTYDLAAQRYLNVTEALPPMSTPFVWAPYVISNGVYQPRLVVSWAPVQGLAISNYDIYIDGSLNAAGMVASNQWTMTAANGLAAGSTHSFQVDYVLTDGRRSARSPSASGSTWQGNYNWGGIPFEWMTQYYGSDLSTWPSASSRPGGGGLTLYQIFLSGGNPLDSSTWLQTMITKTSQGMFLSWNTQPGAMYQVQVSTNFGTWTDLGSPRFAASTTDSIYVGGSAVGYYRVILLR
jgi:hypothetical protein